MSRLWTILLGLALLSGAARATMELETPDGRRVVLKDDMTWEYVQEDLIGNERLVLEVTKVQPGTRSCSVGLMLHNNAPYEVNSLVPQLSAYTADNVLFQTLFAAYQMVKPGRTQYEEIRFADILCQDIALVKVHGADRCSMDDLTRYSPDRGVCLMRIRVEPSERINISK